MFTPLWTKQKLPSGGTTQIGLDGIMPVKRIVFGDNTDTGSSNVPNVASTTTNPDLIRQSIAHNETRGILTNPYSFKKYSGSETMGNANGKYQVTDGELKTYGPKYLGRQVSSQEFLNTPALQDQYMNAKISSLQSRGLSTDQILAAHRGGASDLTPTGLQGLVQKYSGYVNSGMNYLKNAGNQVQSGIKSATGLSLPI